MHSWNCQRCGSPARQAFGIPEGVVRYLAGATDHPVPDAATHDTLILVAWSAALVLVAALVESAITPVVGRLVA